AQATHAATQAAIHSMIAAFPEFHGLNVQQIPAALQVLKANSPQRHAEAVEHLSRIDMLGKAAVEAQQQETQRVNAQLHQWAKQQDVAFAQSVKDESPDTRKMVEANVLKTMQTHYGLSQDELRQAYHSIPAMRSAAFQKMMYDLTKFHTLSEQAAAKR